MKKLNIILRAGMIGLIFLTGFLSSYLLGYVYLNKESPFLIGVKSEKQPSEWLAKSKIQLYDNKIVINVDKAVISKYASTGSMMPVLGENAN